MAGVFAILESSGSNEPSAPTVSGGGLGFPRYGLPV